MTHRQDLGRNDRLARSPDLRGPRVPAGHSRFPLLTGGGFVQRTIAVVTVEEAARYADAEARVLDAVLGEGVA